MLAIVFGMVFVFVELVVVVVVIAVGVITSPIRVAQGFVV